MTQDLIQFIPQQKHFMNEYLSMLTRLLPRGPIWGSFIDRIMSRVVQDSIATSGDTQDNIISDTFIRFQDTISSSKTTSDSFLGIIFAAFAGELAMIESDALDLFKQGVPGTATTMLTDWERVLGLPDDGLPLESKTLEERQAIAHAKLFGDYNVGLNKSFYIDYADKLGFVITIDEDDDDELKTFYVAPVGVDPYDIGSRVGDRLNDSSSTSLIIITIVSGPSDHTYLKFIIEQLKPAHVIIKWEE